MKNKLFAAALTALTLVGVALPASAQEYRGRGHDEWRGRQEITIRQDGRTATFDRRDRMFYRLMERPYNFRPGLTYVYTDRCGRDQCMVLTFARNSRGPIDRSWAPRMGRFFYVAAYDDRRGDDNRWDDRRGDDNRWDDRRGDDNRWSDRDRDGRGYDDGAYRDGDRGPRHLEGGPR